MGYTTNAAETRAPASSGRLRSGWPARDSGPGPPHRWMCAGTRRVRPSPHADLLAVDCDRDDDAGACVRVAGAAASRERARAHALREHRGGTAGGRRQRVIGPDGTRSARDACGRSSRTARGATSPLSTQASARSDPSPAAGFCPRLPGRELAPRRRCGSRWQTEREMFGRAVSAVPGPRTRTRVACGSWDPHRFVGWSSCSCSPPSLRAMPSDRSRRRPLWLQSLASKGEAG